MKKGWIIGALAIIVACVAGFWYWSAWQGNTNEITAVAEQLQVPANWKQVDNHVTPPKTICLEGECPSLQRSWKTNSDLTKETFQEIIHQSGWDFDIRNDCDISEGVSGTVPVCSAEGIVDSYKVSVAVWKNSENKEAKVVLNIQEK